MTAEQLLQGFNRQLRHEYPFNNTIAYMVNPTENQYQLVAIIGRSKYISETHSDPYTPFDSIIINHHYHYEDNN